MPMLIRRRRKPIAGRPYREWPLDELSATGAQEVKIIKLRKRHPKLDVVPHAFLENDGRKSRAKHARDALVALNRDHAAWISPEGEVTPAETPYPFCYGNPTTAHCIAAGFCRRGPACNE